MNSNTPYDTLYKTLDDITNNVEALARETSATLFQKIVDVLKVKDQPVETKVEPVEPVVEAPKEEAVTKDEQSS